MIRLLKEGAKVRDTLRMLVADYSAPSFRGMRMADGSPVSVEMIMSTYGVPRERAEEIARRQSR